MRRRLRDSLRNPFIVIPLVAFVALAAFGVWWFGIRSDGGSADAATTTRQLVTVTSGSMNETVSAEGTVAAAQTDDLSFSSSGTVTAVAVKAGDAVTAGQVLATIDSAQLASDVTAAEATVADAEASLSDDEAAGSSDAQITADESSLTSANDALTTAQQALDDASLVATFDGTVATVDLTVGEELSSGGTGGTNATGTASGSGQSSASIGSSSSSALGGGASSSASSSTTSSTAQIQVVSAGRFTVELAVDSADIDSVAVGQSATVTVSTSSSSSTGFPGGGGFPGGFGGFGGSGTGTSNSASGNTSSGSSDTGSSSSGSGSAANATAADATGTVTEVGQVADASSGVATYPVTITFTSDDNTIYVGSTVTGDITTTERQNVVQVSTFAVTTTNGTSTVLVAKDGTTTGATETRTVTTGLRSNGMVEITKGLTAGEKVIVTIGGIRPGGTGGFTPPSGAFPGGTGTGGTG